VVKDEHKVKEVREVEKMVPKIFHKYLRYLRRNKVRGC